MRKLKLLTCSAIALLVINSHLLKAQGWNQDRAGIYSVGVGGTQVIAFGNGFSGVSGPGLSLNVSGEYKVHRFIGVGFETGIDLFFANYFFGPRFERPAVGYTSIAIPIGAKVNVHILEAANVAIRNKLDVYAGLNLGGGPAIYTAPAPYATVYGFIHVGPQFGIRYWLNPSIAIFGEFGWGATFANIGFTF
jgi:hypothetical protein